MVDVEQIVEDVLVHIDQYSIAYWSTKYELKRGVQIGTTNEYYESPYEIAVGVRELLKLGVLKKRGKGCYKVDE